jgi:hypothetical protein
MSTNNDSDSEYCRIAEHLAIPEPEPKCSLCHESGEDMIENVVIDGYYYAFLHELCKIDLENDN